MLHAALAVAAALVGLAFSASTFERWLAKRRRHELAWSVALAFFALAAFSLAAGAALGWGPVTFRLFYLFGAIVNVPFLALGTVYLLAGERRGDITAAVVSLLAAFAAGVVLCSPLRAPIPHDTLVQGSQVFGPAPRILAGVGSGVSALVIFGGAVLSAYRYRRTNRRMLAANGLIAAGTAILSSSGVLNSVLDEMNGFAVTLVLGISVIFAGFLVAAGGGSRKAPALPRIEPWTKPARATPAPAAAPSRPRPRAAAARR